MSRKLPPIQILRRSILGLFFVGFLVMMILHQRVQGVPAVDAVDPFGGLETLMKFVAGGELVKKIEPGTLVLFGGSVLLALVLSRFFCGWICPFGTLQAIFGWIGGKLFKKRLVVPPRLDRVLRYLKYPVLLFIVFFTWRAGELVIRPYDPLAAFAHLPAGLSEVWVEFGIGLVLLIAILVFSTLYERAFCKYLCPLGALNSLIGRLSRLKISRKKESCISCSLCDRSCPMNVDVSHADAVGSPECIQCMECVGSCPTKPASLSVSFFKRPLKLGTVAALGLGIYLGAAALGQAFGVLDFVAPSLAERAAGGELRVEDIKGSSTWQGIADAFGIDLERLYRAAGVAAARPAPEAMIKDTKALPGFEEFETDAVRVAVAAILGIPYAGEGGDSTSPTPSTAEKEETPVAEPRTPTTPAAAPSAEKAGQALTVPEDFVFEGTMSLTDLARALDAPESAILGKLGLPADFPRDRSFRDMKDVYGYTMPELKERLAR